MFLTVHTTWMRLYIYNFSVNTLKFQIQCLFNNLFPWILMAKIKWVDAAVGRSLQVLAISYVWVARDDIISDQTDQVSTCIWCWRVCNSITGKCCCGRRRNSFKLSSKVWIYASPQLQLENICAACCIGLMLCWCCSQKVIKMSEMLQTHKRRFSYHDFCT